MRRLYALVAALLLGFPAVAAEKTATTPRGQKPERQVQQECQKRAELLKGLSHSYNERPVAMGIATNGGVLEVLTSGTGQSWTIIVTMPDGMACMVAAGQSWETLPPPMRQRPGA
jgi:hypothetical protein